MKISSLALFAFATVIAVGASAVQPAAAYDLSFLNRMNPQYTRCVANVRAQVRGPIDRKLHDAIITACNAKYPAFGK